LSYEIYIFGIPQLLEVKNSLKLGGYLIYPRNVQLIYRFSDYVNFDRSTMNKKLKIKRTRAKIVRAVYCE